MKTDALFYQVFQFDPQALFQLMQLPVEGEYTYESITIKTTEKRMDGFFKRIDGEGPNVFPPHRLIIATLEDCLKGTGGPPGVLTVLKPLTLPSQEKLTEAADQWIREIDALKLPDEKVKILLELLEYAILQRFPELTLEEIRTMLHLTPLDKTVAGQELIQIGKEEGRKEGRKEGQAVRQESWQEIESESLLLGKAVTTRRVPES